MNNTNYNTNKTNKDIISNSTSFLSTYRKGSVMRVFVLDKLWFFTLNNV